jgi:hypothetical protein
MKVTKADKVVVGGETTDEDAYNPFEATFELVWGPPPSDDKEPTPDKPLPPGDSNSDKPKT